MPLLIAQAALVQSVCKWLSDAFAHDLVPQGCKGSHSLYGIPCQKSHTQSPDAQETAAFPLSSRAQLINSPCPGKLGKDLSCLAPKKVQDSQRGSLCLPHAKCPQLPEADPCLAQPWANIPGVGNGPQPSSLTRLLLSLPGTFNSSKAGGITTSPEQSEYCNGHCKLLTAFSVLLGKTLPKFLCT